MKMKSSHDVLQDPKLSSQPVAENTAELGNLKVGKVFSFNVLPLLESQQDLIIHIKLNTLISLCSGRKCHLLASILGNLLVNMHHWRDKNHNGNHCLGERSSEMVCCC